MAQYLLVANKVENITGGWVPALEIARRRLKAKKWGLYANTPHKREIKRGDNLIVYLAGNEKGARTFVATAKASDITAVNNYDVDGKEALSTIPEFVLNISDIVWYKNPVYIKDIKHKLGFIPKNTNKWGCVLQRGVKRLDSVDAEIIIKCLETYN